MAQNFLASIYGFDDGLNNVTQLPSMGVLNSFPAGQIHAYQADAGLTAGSPTTVAINAIIEIVPSGLNVKSRKYLTALTVTQVASAANA